jgi:indole-3-glycerol phosphate synthase
MFIGFDRKQKKIKGAASDPPMHQKLREIIEEKKKEVARLKNVTLWGMDNDLPTLRDFRGAISTPGSINLIAEIKFASPSAGIIREKTEPNSIGRIYEGAGAAAISLLTDKRFFQGDLYNLPSLKKAVSIPILRKDFIIDEIQVRESYYYGADAILLIARILTREQLKDLIDLCRDIRLTPLTEVHDRADLDKAIECGADVIGINNRDLDTFEVNINATFSLAPIIPEGCIVVSESGINDGEDIRALKGTGINAVLMGTALMKSDDIAAKTREMVQAGF